MITIFKKKNNGILEILFVLYSILIYYTYGFASVGDFLLLAMGLYVIFVYKTYLLYKPLFYFLIFILFHEIVLSFFLISIPNYFINKNIVTILNILLIGCIAIALNAEKLYNAFMLIGVVCMIGLLYHFVQIYFFRQNVHPIQFPFLPDLGSNSRYQEIGNRPVSFFPEPASYVTFMMIPLFWNLYKKKILWAVIITFSILLSTSTTGFFLSAVLWSLFILKKGFGKKYKIILILGVTIIIYVVFKISFFDAGINKIQNTNFIEDNIRITSGPYMYLKLPIKHKILGVNAANLSDYVQTGILSNINFRLFVSSRRVYVATFWLCLMKYGIIGIILYLSMYIKLFKKLKPLRPYIIIIIITMFSQSIFIGGPWVMQMVFMLVFYKHYKYNSKIGF